MSKCREAFDMAVIEHLGPSALAGDKMSIYEAAEIMFRAAWNTRGKVDQSALVQANADGVEPSFWGQAIEQEDERG